MLKKKTVVNAFLFYMKLLQFIPFNTQYTNNSKSTWSFNTQYTNNSKSTWSLQHI